MQYVANNHRIESTIVAKVPTQDSSHWDPNRWMMFNHRDFCLAKAIARSAVPSCPIAQGFAARLSSRRSPNGAVAKAIANL